MRRLHVDRSAQLAILARRQIAGNTTSTAAATWETIPTPNPTRLTPTHLVTKVQSKGQHVEMLPEVRHAAELLEADLSFG